MKDDAADSVNKFCGQLWEMVRKETNNIYPFLYDENRCNVCDTLHENSLSRASVKHPCYQCVCNSYRREDRINVLFVVKTYAVVFCIPWLKFVVHNCCS